MLRYTVWVRGQALTPSQTVFRDIVVGHTPKSFSPKETFMIFHQNPSPFNSILYQSRSSQLLISPRKFGSSFRKWKMFFLSNKTSSTLTIQKRFLMRPFPTPQRLQPYNHPPNSPRVESVSKKQSKKHFLSTLMDF